MKRYETKEELIKDLRRALKDNNAFDKYILTRLNNTAALVQEFKEHPNVALGDRKGNWFYIWKNQVVEIDKEWVGIEDLLNRLGELISENK